MSQVYDVVIIGAGPGGLAAAIYTGRGRLNTLVIEKGIPGGQILLTDFVENYPGCPDGVVPFELMEKFRKQAEKFGAKIIQDEVEKIEKKDQLWNVVASQGEYRARTVLVATGSKHRRLELENEGKYLGRGISYCATCDGAFFKEKDLAVVGGGDWALTEALFLTKFCRSLKLIHRRDKFRGEQILQERVFENEKIEVLWDSIVTRISGSATLESLTLQNVKTKETSEINVQGFFISVGLDPNSKFVEGLLDLNEWREIIVKKNMATSQSGIFAAGDVCDACPEQMATAVGTAVAAAIGIEDLLRKY
ncbi:MAG: thioredoxin-disulfide reductase [Candidatus Aminicenantes bacterium]|nr:thioredoxin-disulfide reductase [Candidatus Aminicenantes bacterium]